MIKNLNAALKPLRKSVKLKKYKNNIRLNRERPPNGELYESKKKYIYINYKERPINSSGSSSKLQKNK